MSPSARQKLHYALDLILDALAEDAAETLPPKKRRPSSTPDPVITFPRTPTPQEIEAVEKRLLSRGFKKTG